MSVKLLSSSTTTQTTRVYKWQLELLRAHKKEHFDTTNNRIDSLVVLVLSVEIMAKASASAIPQLLLRGDESQERRRSCGPPTSEERMEVEALHKAVKNHRNVPLAVIAAIVKKDPSTVSERDQTGHLPLHYACSRNAPLPIVRYLVEQYPRGLRIRNDYDCLPLHYACDRECSMDVLKFVTEAYPDGLKHVAMNAKLPIHCVVAKRHPSLEAVKYIAEKYPGGLAVPNELNELPFHASWFRLRSSRPDIIEYILNKYPDALFHSGKTKDHRDLPLLHHELYRLHVKHATSLDDLKYLLRFYYPPGDPCLHVAQISPDPIAFLLELQERTDNQTTRKLELLKLLESIVPSTKQHQFLVHHAIEQISSTTIVKHLVSYPWQLEVFDQHGRIPLFWALWNASSRSKIDGRPCIEHREKPEASVKFVLSRSNQSTRLPDPSGRLALHLALEWDVPLPVLRAVFEHNPEALYVADRVRGCKPVHVAAEFCQAPDPLYLLLRQDPDLLQKCFHRSESTD